MRFFRGATERPVGYSQLNRSNPLAGGCTYLSNCDSHYPFDVVNKSLGVPAGSIATSIGTLGPAIDTVSASVSNNISISNSVDKLVPLDKVTIIVIRQKKDSTARSAANWGSSSFFRGAMPSTAGIAYWEFGTPNASVSGLTWDTRVDYMVFIAGPTKGREIWRNGQRIVKTSDTNARASDATPFYLGNDGNFASDLEYIYLFGVFDHEWSDTACLTWFKNPWQLFKAPYNGLFVTTLGQFLTQSSTLTNSNTFYPSTISAGNVTLSQSSPATNTHSFYTQAIATGSVTLSQASPATNNNSFYTQAIIPGSVSISQSSSITNTHSFYTQAIIPGSVSIGQSSTIANQANFYVPIVNNESFSLTQTETISNQNSFYPLTIEHVIPSNTKRIYLEYGKNNIYLSLPKTTIFSR